MQPSAEMIERAANCLPYKAAELPTKEALERIYETCFSKEAMEDEKGNSLDAFIPFSSPRYVILVAQTERAADRLVTQFAAVVSAMADQHDKRKRIAYVPSYGGDVERRLRRLLVHVLHVNALGLGSPAVQEVVVMPPLPPPVPTLSTVGGLLLAQTA